MLRFISFEETKQEKGEEEGEEEGRGEGATGFTGAFLPNFVDVAGEEEEGGGGAGGREDFGLQRADHIVGNVWDMLEHVSLSVALVSWRGKYCCTYGLTAVLCVYYMMAYNMISQPSCGLM